jgi:putative DNA primase/helicase
MTAPKDPVKAVFDAPEDVDLPDSLAAPHPDRDAPDDAYDPGDFPDDGRYGAPPDPDLPPPPEADCAAFPLNDVGNGQRFVRWFGDNLLFVGRIGWHVWDGRRWVLDADIAKGMPPRTRAMAQDMGPLIEREIPFLQPSDSQRAMLTNLGRKRSDLKFLKNLPESEQGANWSDEVARLAREVAALEKDLDGWFKTLGRRLTWAKDVGNSGRMNNMVAEASVTLRREVAEMDADPLAVNCLTGTLRLVIDPGGDGSSRVARMDLAPHARGDLITRIMGVDYDPKATCPKFDRFLARIQPEAVMRQFLQRWFGYSMFGTTAEQAMCYFFGVGANGKSVLSDLMAKIIGEYAATARVESLTGGERRGGGDATPDLMALVGARFVRASEPDEGVRWNEGFIKEITGGEVMKVRALHSDFIDFVPVFKLTLSGNHEPEIRGTDDGIWRRLMIVPFPVQIPKAERRDMGELIADLMTEAPGILNWLVAGAIDWAEAGLQPPEAVTKATQTLRDESDPIGEFLRECCLGTGDESDWISRATFVEAFNFWRDSGGLARWGGNTVSKKMRMKQDVWRHPQTGLSFTDGKKVGERGFRGLRLLDLFKARYNAAPRDHKGKVMFKAGSELADDD